MSKQRKHLRLIDRLRHRRPRSIRQGVVRVALVPSVALIVLWLVGASYLGYTGFYARQVVASVRQVSIPAVNGLASLQKERQLSMAALATSTGGRHDVTALTAQRKISDEDLASMRSAANSALSGAPSSVKNQMAELTGQLDKLPTIRSQIDARSVGPRAVYAFYNRLLDSATAMFHTQASIAPTEATAQGAFAATDLFRISDQMSRASSQASGGFAAGRFGAGDYLAFSKLVGGYHAQLAAVQPDLVPEVRADVRRMMHTEAWTRLSAAEDALLAHGAWKHGVPTGLPVDAAGWDSLTDAVSADLIAVTKKQADEVSAQGLDTGNRNLAWAVGGSVAAAAAVAFAIMWAVRRSTVLVGRTLIPRIRQLGVDADRTVREQLPEIQRRLAAGERVDVQRELAPLDSAADEDDVAEQGQDEIDSVRRTLNQAVAVAADAAVSEYQARAGAMQLFLGIARRNQLPLQQVLRELDKRERAEEDPDRLAEWFEVHHRVNQARGVNESLIILGGGEPGRKWHRPVPLLDVLRQAIAQTEDYERIKLESTPDVQMRGDAVNSTIHLITQLLNNAVGFSSDKSQVRVRGMQVDRGIAVEVEDQGIGMSPEDLDRVNTLLRSAPQLTISGLGDGSQLGFWVVAQLAQRLGIGVELRASPYGGVLAIVLLPVSLLDVAEGEGRHRSGDTDASTETRQMRAVDAPPVREPVGAGVAARGTVPVERAGAWSDPVPDLSRESTSDGWSTGTGGEPDGWAFTPARRPAPRPTEPATRATDPAPRRGEPGPRPTVPAEPRPGRPALPERQPQQHLAPQLRADPQQSGRPGQDTDMADPERIRTRLSRFQQGTRAGRSDD